MPRRPTLAAAVATLALVLAPAAHAQPGALIGSSRFAGCDAFYCEDVTFLTYTNLDPTVSPYLLSMRGTVTALAPVFAAGNPGFEGANFITPLPLQYMSDWDDGFSFFTVLTPADPTLAFDFTPFGLRVDVPVVASTTLRYYGYLNPGDNSKDFGFFTLAPVATSTAPEPATLGLVAGGVLLLGVGARRRRAV